MACSIENQVDKAASGPDLSFLMIRQLLGQKHKKKWVGVMPLP